MGADPLVGVVYHWLGGLAAASFYVPFRRVRGWAWETSWLVGGIFSWIIAPLAAASLLVPGFWSVIQRASPGVLAGAAGFGALWGVGGLAFGLSMRYLGIALGYAVALGLCAAFGTLVPPLFAGEMGRIVRETSGQVTLLGVGVCLAGITVSGLAGMSKERELAAEQKADTVPEFSFRKGIVVALFAGVMSACFAYGLAAGKALAADAKVLLASQGRLDLWQNLPVLVVVLWGGFATNFVWCAILHRRGRAGGRKRHGTRLPETAAGDEPDPSAGTRTTHEQPAPADQRGAPVAANWLFCGVAGITWYLQFFFYSMGQTRMGRYDFSSWTLHMASIILFSTLWGIALREWRGTSLRTHLLIAAGLVLLLGSTLVVGWGSYLKAAS